MARSTSGSLLGCSRKVLSVVAAMAMGMVGAVAVGAAPAAAATVPVAVLPNATGQCPGSATQWWIQQDNEDKRNANERYGWIGGISSGNNTRYLLCEVDGNLFRTVLNYQVNFAVLALGQTCPAGALTVDRYFDDEDNNNASESSVPADSATRNSGDNTTFRFCWFINYSPDRPAVPSSAFPNLGGTYGGFGPAGSPFSESGWVHTDDEDSNNKNTVTAVDPTLAVYRNLWLEAGSNTTMRIVRVK